MPVFVENAVTEPGPPLNVETEDGDSNAKGGDSSAKGDDSSATNDNSDDTNGGSSASVAGVTTCLLATLFSL